MLFIKLLLILSEVILFYLFKFFNKKNMVKESWLILIVQWIILLTDLSI